MEEISQEISAEQLSLELYLAGVSNFEGGNYQAAIAVLERARALTELDTNLGGDILIWLANSYDAAGRTEDAIALCRSLKKHPIGSIRKSARFMLGIFTAPQLSKLEGVVSEVPLLESPDSYQSKPIARSPRTNNADQKPFREVSLEKPQPINSRDVNKFLLFAIAVFSAILWLWATT